MQIYAENAYAYIGQENAIYLHPVLMAHRVQDKFVTTGFFEHPKFYPKLLMHLFETSGSKSEIITLQSANTAQARRITQLETEQANLKQRIDQLDTRLQSL